MKINLKFETKSLKLKANHGFTLIELLIVMSIMSILAAIMFGSQYSIREQTQLFQDHYKILDYINQAKSFTLGAFMRDSSLCGYGVSFQKPENNEAGGKIILYKDRKEVIPNRESGVAGTDCNSDQHSHEFNPNSDAIYQDNNGKDFVFELNKTEQLNFNGSNVDVVFNAPALNVFLTKDGTNIDDSVKIILHAIKSDQDLNININQFGQVSTQ